MKTSPEGAPSPWRAEVTLGPYPEVLAQHILQALLPESGEGVPGTRAEVTAGTSGEVRLTVEAPTTSGLRAALNAHLRWVDLAVRTYELARAPRAPVSPGGPARQDASSGAHP